MFKVGGKISFVKNNFVYLFLAVLGLPHCIGFSLVAPSGGHFPVMAQGLLIVVASPVAEHRLKSTRASVVAVQAQELWFLAVEHRLSSCD